MPQRKRPAAKRTAPKSRAREDQPEDKVDRTKWLHQELTKGVERLATEGGWKAFLNMKSRLHRYSFRNTVLVLSQDPEATMVASYTDWTRKFGRKVLAQKDGGQPLYIFAPHARWVTETNQQTGAEERVKRQGFHATHCYDVKSTMGPDLPEPPKLTTLDGDAPRELWNRVVDHLGGLGYRVEMAEIPGRTKGDTSPEGLVRVDSRLSPLEQLAVLVHELGHVENGHMEEIDQYRAHRGRFEVESESTAYIVMTALGLEVGDFSFEYIVGWADGDTKLLLETAEKVCKTADRLIDDLMPEIQEEIERERFGTDREEVGDVVAFEI